MFPSTGDLVSCSYCPWRGQSEKLLFRHIKRQHWEVWEREQESREDNFKCRECGKWLFSERALSNHIGQNHRKDRLHTARTETALELARSRGDGLHSEVRQMKQDWK